MFMVSHVHPDGTRVLSFDIKRHHDECGVLYQRDILDELLEEVKPLAFVVVKPPPTIVAPPEVKSFEEELDCVPSPDTAFGDKVSSLVPHSHSRRRHNMLTDALIIKFVEVHGAKWRSLARSLGGRLAGYSDDVVRNRYIRLMAAAGTPYETHRIRTRTPRKPEAQIERWTEADDALIVKGIEKYDGTHWSKIALLFGGLRTQQAIRNRANRIGLCDQLSADTPTPGSPGPSVVSTE